MRLDSLSNANNDQEETKIRVRGKHSQFDFKKGNIWTTINEQAKHEFNRKVND